MPKWDPKVERREHPFGEAGVRSSLDEVAKAIAKGSTDPRVRTYSIEVLDEARKRGLGVSRPRQRAEVLLTTVQKKLWAPDPFGAEYIPAAHLLACDPDKVKDGQVCVRGDDCFAEGTLVLTDETVGETYLAVPVEELRPGTRIWGLERWSVVEAVWSKGELLVDEIEFDGAPGGRLWLTPDHHVYVIEGGVERRITVAELRPGAIVPKPVTPGVVPSEVAYREVRSIQRGVGTVPCWDITTDDHRVYLPEHGVTVSQCDGLATVLGAMLMSVGIPVLVVGHAYSGMKNIEHVLCAAHIDSKWHYADPSTELSLGRCVPFTRERLLSVPDIKALCDDTYCLSKGSYDPDDFVDKGSFVGVGSLPTLGLSSRVVWRVEPDDLTLLEAVARRF